MYTTTPGQTAQLISKVQDVADTYLQTLQVVFFAYKIYDNSCMLVLVDFLIQIFAKCSMDLQ